MDRSDSVEGVVRTESAARLAREPRSRSKEVVLSLSVSATERRVLTILGQVTNDLSKSYERLASGSRINSPSDDPAGLSLATILESESRVATTAIRNTNDGFSLTNMSSSAMDETSNLLQRMAELAEQSANSVYTNTQRSALSAEFLALGSEVERIAKTTTFNDISLLSNSSNVTLQVGLDGSSNSQITVSGVSSTLDSLGLASSGSSTLTFSIIADTVANSTSAALNALSAVNQAITDIGLRRGVVGGVESRLTTTLSYLQVLRENLIAAGSRITDIDVAEEVAISTALQVRQQAASAVLAQARIDPEIVLRLLG